MLDTLAKAGQTIGYVLTWNMPGCLPEMEPMEFLAFSDAKQALLDELDRLDMPGALDDDEWYALDAVKTDIKGWMVPNDINWDRYVYSITKQAIWFQEDQLVQTVLDGKVAGKVLSTSECDCLDNYGTKYLVTVVTLNGAIRTYHNTSLEQAKLVN